MRNAGFAAVDWSESVSREYRGVRVICGIATESDKSYAVKASSPLLHRGVATLGHRNLILAPDGSGSGVVFSTLRPSLVHVKDMSIYALNSPFVKNPPGLDRPPAIEEPAAINVAEIKRRQPEGPYLVGGYSNSGVLAFEAVRQLP